MAHPAITFQLPWNLAPSLACDTFQMFTLVTKVDRFK